jgi:hypothetical protein
MSDSRAALVSAITYARARGKVGRNVASPVKAPPGKSPGRPSRALTQEQHDRFKEPDPGMEYASTPMLPVSGGHRA